MKRKVIKENNFIYRINPLTPFILYMLFDYYTLPMWGFAVLMPLWVIQFVACVCFNYGVEKVDLLGNDKPK